MSTFTQIVPDITDPERLEKAPWPLFASSEEVSGHTPVSLPNPDGTWRDYPEASTPYVSYLEAMNVYGALVLCMDDGRITKAEPVGAAYSLKHRVQKLPREMKGENTDWYLDEFRARGVAVALGLPAEWRPKKSQATWLWNVINSGSNKAYKGQRVEQPREWHVFEQRIGWRLVDDGELHGVPGGVKYRWEKI